MRQRSLSSPCPVPTRRRARRTRRSRRPRRPRRPRRHENSPGGGVLGPEEDLGATLRAGWREGRPREIQERGPETGALGRPLRGTEAPQEKPERKWRQPSGLKRKTQGYVFPENPRRGDPETRKEWLGLPTGPRWFQLPPSMTLDLPDLRRILERRERHKGCLPPRGSRGRSSRGAPRGKGRGIDRPTGGQTHRWSARNAGTPRTGRDKHCQAQGKASHTEDRRRGSAAGTECRDTADPWQARDGRKSIQPTPLDLTIPPKTSPEEDWGVGTRSTPSPGPRTRRRSLSLESLHTSEPEESDVLEVDPDSTYATEFFQELKMD